jgi:hypothetical protein
MCLYRANKKSIVGASKALERKGINKTKLNQNLGKNLLKRWGQRRNVLVLRDELVPDLEIHIA